MTAAPVHGGVMGTNLSHEDFSSCSPTLSSQTSFPYQPSCISNSTPSLRISSAPAARASMRSRLEKTDTPPPPLAPKPLHLTSCIPSSSHSPTISANSKFKDTIPNELPKAVRIESKKSFSVEVALSCPTVVAKETSSCSNAASSSSSPVSAASGPLSSTVLQHERHNYRNDEECAAVLHPPAYSLPPVPGKVDRSCNCFCSRDVEVLRNETRLLRSELARNRLTISQMKEKEKLLRHRLSEQAKRQLERGSTRFEDINLGDNRPSQLIRRYGNLYTEGRLEAMDALDEIGDVAECNDLKEKLLLSVVVLAFRNARKTLEEMKSQMRLLLHLTEQHSSSVNMPDSSVTVGLRSRPLPPSHPAIVELDEMIGVYMRKTLDHQNLSKSYQEVQDRVWSTLFDFPQLRFCRGLQHYIEECVRIAWALTIQNPSFVVDYKPKTFCPDAHVRFHTSDPESVHVRSVLWPTLREGSETGQCVYKGVIVT